MPILIDAWNFIRNRKSEIPDDDQDSLQSAKELIEHLERFQETHRDPITLVFDSSNEYLGLEHKNTPLLSLIAAKNADDRIKRYIDKVPERQRRNLRVVSSDNSVYYYAKSAYATPVTCEEFWHTLTKGLDRT